MLSMYHTELQSFVVFASFSCLWSTIYSHSTTHLLHNVFYLECFLSLLFLTVVVADYVLVDAGKKKKKKSENICFKKKLHKLSTILEENKRLAEIVMLYFLSLINLLTSPSVQWSLFRSVSVSVLYGDDIWANFSQSLNDKD